MSAKKTAHKADWTLIRRKLERRKRIITGELVGETEEIRELAMAKTDEDFGDPGDIATDTMQQGVLQAEASALNEELEQIETALLRIDEGTYGVCTECGKAIPPARLAALPIALRDIACEQRFRAKKKPIVAAPNTRHTK